MPPTPDIITPLPIAAERSSAELLRAVAEETTDAVFVKDRAGRYLFCNAAAGRFVGRAPEEVIGQNDTAIFDPASARLVMERDQRVMTTGRAEPMPSFRSPSLRCPSLARSARCSMAARDESQVSICII